MRKWGRRRKPLTAPLGTYLAALVSYERITGHNPQDLPAEALVAGQTLNVDAATIRFLQRIAPQTVLRFPSHYVFPLCPFVICCMHATA